MTDPAAKRQATDAVVEMMLLEPRDRMRAVA